MADRFSAGLQSLAIDLDSYSNRWLMDRGFRVDPMRILWSRSRREVSIDMIQMGYREG